MLGSFLSSLLTFNKRKAGDIESSAYVINQISKICSMIIRIPSQNQSIFVSTLPEFQSPPKAL